MNWELEKVEPIECTIYNSEVYTVINRIVTTEYHKEYSGQRLAIRVDVLVDGHGEKPDTPLRSFVGPGNDVRKRVIAWLRDRPLVQANCISSEHASYIGYEISRAMTNENYVQD